MKKVLRSFITLFLFCCVFTSVSFAATQEEVAAGEFIKKLQLLAAEGNKQELAKLVDYPLTMNGKKGAANADAFVKRYNEIFTKDVQSCLRDHDLKEPVFSRNGEYMVGQGCIWFFPTQQGNMVINAVNTSTK